MIEVAAAAPMVSSWAGQVGFFALGTNDLAASALGIDRDDPAAAGQIDPLHPGLLRLMADIVKDAHGAGRSVSVCGEVASDPAGALALAALGVDTLSVAVNQFKATRQALARARVEGLGELKTRLLRQRSAREARALLAAGSVGVEP
jgi:phosphoenolpyruvate-protein kinase (PTS system EI component)